MQFSLDLSMDVLRRSPATLDALLMGVDPALERAPKDRTRSVRSTSSAT